MWSADTRKRERPEREALWETPLVNGDIQVLYEGHLYYLGMWNEGGFEPMAQLSHDFDVRRHLAWFDRLEEEEGNADLLCGLFRKEGIDQRPLFQRGYAAPFLPFERFVQQVDGSTTREWSRGYHAGNDDRWLGDGYVNTGRIHPSCMEPIDAVKWLL